MEELEVADVELVEQQRKLYKTERPELVVIETAETSDGSSQSEHHDGDNNDDDDGDYEPREEWKTIMKKRKMIRIRKKKKLSIKEANG